MTNRQRQPSNPPVYDALAPHYERALGPLERLLLGRLRAAALATIPAGSRVIEIGAGTGLNFEHYPAGTHGAATDVSREMLRLARAKPRPAGVHLIQNSAEALPFADATFDAGIATLVFCSVPSPARAFAELRRVVRAGGRLTLVEHVRPEGLLGHAFDALNLLTVRLFDDHFNRRTADEAARAGLRISRLERHALGIVQLINCEV